MGKDKKKQKRSYGRIIVLLLIVFIWYFNNLTLKQTNAVIYSSKISSNVKIAVISDLHCDKIHVSTSKIFSKIKKNKPNLIFVMGDMYTNGSSEKIISTVTDFVISLTDICPVYFVPGEHDRDEDYLASLKLSPVNVMDYKTSTIWMDRNEIQIYGIDNVYFSETFDLENEFDPPDRNVFSILLAHIPMYEQYQKFGADLTVCGDTHGGIVQIPFIGCAYYEGQWLPEIFRSSSEIYDKGLFENRKGYMFITSGLGNNPVPARFCNRPEVAFIDLMPAN